MREAKYDGAYYLAGLAVECSLKACIAKKTKRFDFPDKKVVNESYDHDLTKLLRTAGLIGALDRDCRANPALAANWAVVKDWTVESRYTVNNATKAQDLYNAVSRRPYGIIAWIRQRW